MSLRSSRLTFLLLLCITLALLFPGQASAHAVLLGSSPEPNQQLDDSPGEIRLWFNEDVNLAGEAVRLLDALGSPVRLEDVGYGENATVIRASIPGALPDGSYVVVWAAISADGHTIRGSFIFSVGEPADATLVPPDTSNPRWVETLASGLRSLAYGVALALIGSVAFLARPSRRESLARLQRPLRIGSAVLLVLAIAVLAAEGLVANGGKPGELFDSSTLCALRDGRHLAAAAIVVFGAVLAYASVVALGRHSSLGKPVALLAGFVMASGFAWSGHSAAGSNMWLGISANTIHMASAGLWAGALLVLAVEGRGSADADYRAMLARSFSHVATVAFPVAILSGVYLSWRILPGLAELTDTTYGRLLLAKIALVAVVAAIAIVNRQHMLARLSRNSGDGTAFRRLVVVELGFVAAIAIVTGSLTGQPPTPGMNTPIPTELPAPAPVFVDTVVGPYHAIAEISPGRQGRNDIELQLHILGDSVEGPPLEVEMIFTHPETGTGPFRVEFAPDSGGTYRAWQLFPLAGTWTTTFAIRVSEFDQQRVTFEIVIR